MRLVNKSKTQKMVWFVILILFVVNCQDGNGLDWEEMAQPVEIGKWVQPSTDYPAQPIWGHVNGLQIGLPPMPGPRGLIRIYTPYLGHKDGKMINFLALEPVVEGEQHRGFSELEMSALDGVRGKRFWSAENSESAVPGAEDQPVQGKIERQGDRETLTLYVFSEPFENGAHVYVRLRFYSDKPYEVEVSTYKAENSAALEHFIVTATMGNFARLRELYLDSRRVLSRNLWPDYQGDAFTTHRHFSVNEFIPGGTGLAYVLAAPDELHPSEADYKPGTHSHWKYYGETATQYWAASPTITGLECLVNGRYTYWASQSPIPGGISFENFELKAPFSQGMTFVFGVDPRSPEALIDHIRE